MPVPRVAVTSANLDLQALTSAVAGEATGDGAIASFAGLVRDHVVGLKAVVNAQARGDWSTAYGRLREAAAHMQMIADPLAGAIAKQFPEKFAMR